jgi:hypothetical protein
MINICPKCKQQEMKYFPNEETYQCEYCGFIIELNKDLNKEKPNYIN